MIIPQTVLALRGPGGVGKSSRLLLRFHAGAPPPGTPSLRPLGQPGAGGSQDWVPDWPLAWPAPQDGLGQGWLRLKWAKCRFWSTIDEKVKVL